MAFTGSLFEVATLEHNLQRPLRIWHWGSLHSHPWVFCTQPPHQPALLQTQWHAECGVHSTKLSFLAFLFLDTLSATLSTLLLIKIKLKYHFLQVLDITLSILDPLLTQASTAPGVHYTHYTILGTDQTFVSPPPQIHILKPWSPMWMEMRHLEDN